jgi:hypothetical protein
VRHKGLAANLTRRAVNDLCLRRGKAWPSFYRLHMYSCACVAAHTGEHWIKGLSRHKFGVGDRVNFIPAFYRRSAPAIEFEVVRQLPDLNGEFFYRIKSSEEPHERVVGESQLRRRQLNAQGTEVAQTPLPDLPRPGNNARRRGTTSKSKPKPKAAPSCE